MPVLDPKIKNLARTWRDFLLEIIFPEFCLDCGRPGSYLCLDCRHKLVFLRRQTCPYCEKININGQSCRHCQKEGYLDGVLSAGSYSEPLLRKIIKTYKFQSLETLHRTLEDFLIRFLHCRLDEFKIEIPKFQFFQENNLILVPIPISAARHRFRGFSQCEVIARKICQEFSWPLDLGLIKFKNTPAQTKLSDQARRKNPCQAFRWSGAKLTGRSVILLDDVFTTGATLNEAARVLKENGAGKVWGLTLAKGK